MELADWKTRPKHSSRQSTDTSTDTLNEKEDQTRPTSHLSPTSLSCWEVDAPCSRCCTTVGGARELYASPSASAFRVCIRLPAAGPQVPHRSLRSVGCLLAASLSCVRVLSCGRVLLCCYVVAWLGRLARSLARGHGICMRAVTCCLLDHAILPTAAGLNC